MKEAILEEISDGKSVTLCVTGASMRPYLLGDGSERVIVSQHKPEELKPGIIICFFANGGYVFHRIIKKASDVLTIQGDGNCLKTEIIKDKEVIGIVRYIVRGEGNKTSPYTFSAKAYWYIWYIISPLRKYFLFIYNKVNK